MRFIALSVLCVLQLFVSAETISEKEKNQKERKIDWEECGWYALKTAGMSVAIIGGTAVVVPALGFTAGGVAAGSTAAWIQSTYLGGTIASGSIFAGMQSIGAAGLAASTKVVVGAISALVAGAPSILTQNNSPDDSSSSEKLPGSLKTKMDKYFSKQIYHRSSVRLSYKDFWNFQDNAKVAGEQVVAKDVNEMFGLLEEIEQSFEKEEK